MESGPDHKLGPLKASLRESRLLMEEAIRQKRYRTAAQHARRLARLLEQLAG